MAAVNTVAIVAKVRNIDFFRYIDLPSATQRKKMISSSIGIPSERFSPPITSRAAAHQP
jgi:hypothetical protein